MILIILKDRIMVWKAGEIYGSEKVAGDKQYHLYKPLFSSFETDYFLSQL